MKKLLVSENDVIRVNFVLGERKSGEYVADINKESLEKTYGEELVKDSVETHWAEFRRPTFADTIDINGRINTPDGISLEFNPLAVRFARMSKLIKKWSLKDGEKDIPATPQSIGSLDPFIASIIGMLLDAAIGV